MNPTNTVFDTHGCCPTEPELLCRHLSERRVRRAQRRLVAPAAELRRRRWHPPPLLPRLLRPGLRRVGADRQSERRRREPQRCRPVAVGGQRKCLNSSHKNIYRYDLCYQVIDEADKLLDMDFERAIADVLKAVPKERQTYLFSATMTKKVWKHFIQFEQTYGDLSSMLKLELRKLKWEARVRNLI
ncbi:uncharacterized protein LOC109712361 isoform X3 [Ananas comosus]|uniref:Uncharacterized protein LOC109712361 isoform X3 n=1 Tax=Ananas comosus TaxID=4615 RepID=A0A6P5F650_ANACO|nr:uncharacterized protein LOC109712361 isoform X3 [Ananas comosus]